MRKTPTGILFFALCITGWAACSKTEQASSAGATASPANSAVDAPSSAAGTGAVGNMGGRTASSAGRSGAAAMSSSGAHAGNASGASAALAGGTTATSHAAGRGVSGVSGATAGVGGASAAAGSSGTATTTSAAGSGGAPAHGACTGPNTGTQGKNPLFSDVYTADPGVLVDGCTFYIHCGHDEGPSGFVLREWYALWSTDMVNWERKVAMRLSDFTWADANAWAGQVVKKGDKYYWFAPVQERGGGMTIGVAVSDSPTGPFADAIGKPLINDAFEMSNAGFRQPSDTPFTIDPSVFIDDDGQAYLHYGGFSRMMVAKLSADLTAIVGKLQEVTPRGFFEAPYLFKHDGRYYEVYAAGTNPATIDYATSDSPLGPWMYGGRIMDALPARPGEDAPTSHPAVAQLAGQWYLVYHISNGPNGGGTYKREVAIDKLTIKPDGTIDKVTPSAGLQF